MAIAVVAVALTARPPLDRPLTRWRVWKDALYAAFAIPTDVPPSAALKELEAIAPDFSVTALRAWLAERAVR